MSETLEAIKKLIDSCTTDDRLALAAYLRKLVPHPLESEWGVDASTILSAIRRSSDLTKRGVRGIIAEAVFESDVVPILRTHGWQAVAIVGDQPYDVVLKRHDISARIQIKLQRREKGVPKLYYPTKYSENPLYVVEVQKTRSGTKKSKVVLQGTSTEISTTNSLAVKTRPYRFGEFDILAVNMHPSSGDWKSFRYTLSSRLLPRSEDQSLIEIFQPVAAQPNKIWTDDASTVLSWLDIEHDAVSVADLLPNRARGNRS